MTESQYNSILNVAKTTILATQSLSGSSLTLDDINNEVEKVTRLFHLDDETIKNRLIDDLERIFCVSHSGEAYIFDDYDDPHNWYTSSERENTLFWDKYKSYLASNTKIDIRSIALLDEDTLPNIMNCLANPKEQFEGKRLKRGLIIGDVQSGKTATYSGLICKAADAGYKVVILLAGTTESLRQQTQQRIDEGIVGFSRRKVGKEIKSGRVGVGLDNKPLPATSFTSCANDFVGDSDKISTTLSQHTSLVIFVVKKNTSVLAKLLKWLKEQNLDPIKGYVDVPMLLIDDEADNASVNTRNDETNPTKTNALIRQICDLFKNATYVGFTATPFANVFIDPDSVDNMQRADLFPEHFIYALPTPSNYVGANKIFYEEGDYYRNLRFISDIEEPDYTSEEYADDVKYNIETLNQGPFYYRHKKEWRGILPDSLREAILCFFLVNVIRDLRGERETPRSMLINMSRFVRVQHHIKDYVDELYKDVTDTIRYDFSDKKSANKRIHLYNELVRIWETHFNQINLNIDRVLSKVNLINALDKINVVVVNGSRNSDKLDYKSNKNLRVIAIGGLALSRGLTLEGLIISYFYRNTATFDVLMQMGRWFGYRDKYEDLFQIWTSQTSAEWYAEISRASDELKADIKEMCAQKLTPKDFGIKVRDDSLELQITARNKMRASHGLTVRFSYYGDIYDTPYISVNAQQNRSNWESVKDFTAHLFASNYTFGFADIPKHIGEDVNSKSGASRYFADVPKQDIISFLSNVKCSLVNPNFNVKSLLDFLSDPQTIGIDKWDVVFQGGNSDVHYDIEGLENITCTERSIFGDNRRIIQVSSRRRMLGLREGKFALTQAQINQAESACREYWQNVEHIENADTRSIPLRAYFRFLPERKPMLLIVLIKPKDANPDPTKKERPYVTQFREELGNDKLVAFAIGFPGAANGQTVKEYRVNEVYFKLHMQDDVDDNEQYDEDETD